MDASGLKGGEAVDVRLPLNAVFVPLTALCVDVSSSDTNQEEMLTDCNFVGYIVCLQGMLDRRVGDDV